MAEDGLRAVLDWELVHLGDPLEDLAWLCVKAWRFGARPEAAGLGGVDELLAAYEAAGGGPVDRGAFVARELRAGSGPEKRARAGLEALGASSFPELSSAIRAGKFDGRDADLWPFLWTSVADRLAVANPGHAGREG